MENPVAYLNKSGLRVSFHVESHLVDEKIGFLCRVMVIKDRETLDCEGVGLTKKDAKYAACHQMVGLLKLLFPMIPLALFDQKFELNTFQQVGFLPLKSSYTAIHLYEIKSAAVYVYVDRERRRYCVALGSPIKNTKIEKPRCPVHLFNNPIRFADWSQGVISQAQEFYVSERIKHT